MDNMDWKPMPSASEQIVPMLPPSATRLSKANSRRNFLRGAAIATAAATAAGATLTAIAGTSTRSVPQIISSFGPNWTPVSGSCTLAATVCFESGDTTKLNGVTIVPYDVISAFEVEPIFKTQPAKFYLWFTVQNVPNGNYSVTYDLPSAFKSVGDLGEPAGIAVDVFMLNPCTATSCPKEEPSVNTEKHFSSLAAIAAPGVITVQNGPVDLQVKIYLKWFGTSLPPTNGTTYNFSATLSNGGSVNVSATSRTITAKP